MNNESKKLEAVLKLVKIHKAFDTRQIHQGLSIHLEQNEILGLMGYSGTGKSLLLKMIVGLEKPDQGQILFENIALNELSERELYKIRQKMGYVFQNGALFDSLSVFENLAYPLKKHRNLDDKVIKEIVFQKLTSFGLEYAADLFPSALSGGMQKRIGLLRATILDPRLILFDEPAAGLDPMNIRRLIQNIRIMQQARAVSGIFVSHDFGIISALCDRVALLKNGNIYSLTSPREMRQSHDPIIRNFTDNHYENLAYEENISA